MTWLLFAVFLVACGAAAATGAMFPPDRWYRDLSKPAWNPPDWLFPIAWTLLYLALAFVAARNAAAPWVMAFWAAQIALNALWTPVFFGLHRMRAALVVIGVLWLAVAGLLAALWPADPLGFWLLVPYLVWVSYAGALNASLLSRNPRAEAA